MFAFHLLFIGYCFQKIMLQSVSFFPVLYLSHLLSSTHLMCSLISLRLHRISSLCDTAQFGTNVLKLHASDQRRLNNIDRLSTVNCSDDAYVWANE